MIRRLPAAGSYAPVTILIQEPPGGETQVAYDTVASATVPNGDAAAAQVARRLDIEVLGRVSATSLVPTSIPAVTLGLAINRRFPWAYGPGYVIAQFAAAIVAAAVTWGLYGDQARGDRRPWRHGPGCWGFREAGARGGSHCHLRAGPSGRCGQRRGGQPRPGDRADDPGGPVL
jgi:hypothetical protein